MKNLPDLQTIQRFIKEPKIKNNRWGLSEEKKKKIFDQAMSRQSIKIKYRKLPMFTKIGCTFDANGQMHSKPNKFTPAVVVRRSRGGEIRKSLGIPRGKNGAGSESRDIGRRRQGEEKGTESPG